MSFFEELQRRKVVRVATGYLVAAWIAIQAASIALPAFGAPEWTLRAFILMFVLGFPLALMLSWALDITSEGIQPSPRSKSDKIMAMLILLLIAGAIGWYYWKPPHVGVLAGAPAGAAHPAVTAAPATSNPAAQPTPTTTPAPIAAAPPATPATPATGTPAPTPSSTVAAPAPKVHPPLAPTMAQPAEHRPALAMQAKPPKHAADAPENGSPELSARCREILHTARSELGAGGQPRQQRRRERFAVQAQLREADCLEEMRR